MKDIRGVLHVRHVDEGGGPAESIEYDSVEIKFKLPKEWFDENKLLKPEIYAAIHRRVVNIQVTEEISNL